MKYKKASVLWTVVLTLGFAVLGAAQQTTPSSAADPSATQSEPASKGSEGSEMPNTASPIPLIALLGAASLAAGAVTDRISRHVHKR